MKYSCLIALLGKEGFFDLASVIQLTGERRDTIRVQLSRWCRSGKLIPLRRGMYAFPEVGTAVTINRAALANSLYSPSYLSTYWALGFYGLIPEKVVVYTSVSSRVTRSFQNPLGAFQYRAIRQNAFFGYEPREIGGGNVLIAKPEKELLDLWYLESGEWTEARMREMRFQNTEVVNRSRLTAFAERYRSARLVKTAGMWSDLADKDEQGNVEL